MTRTELLTLKRAGFTDRQISDHRQKFQNLLRVNPCLTTEIAQFHRMQEEIRQLRDFSESQQAKIDQLMLEFCPDEMTKEQLDRWAECQRVSKD